MKSLTCRSASICWCRLAAAGAGLLLIIGCAAFRPETPAGTLSVYTLNAARRTTGIPPPRAETVVATLLISVPRAHPGFDGKRLIYVRQAQKIEHFANSEWVDTPARMLSPLLVIALENRGVFRAVVQQPGSARGDLRLDTQVVRLQHEFDGGPSRVRFVLRASLIDDASRDVVATREFEAVADAPSDDPYGGVLAANQVVAEVLEQLADFCSDELDIWRREKNPSSAP